MTCIVGLVGKKGVLIAGDSQVSTDWIKREDKGPKVFSLLDTVAIGYCGSGRFGQILEYHLESLKSPPLGKDELRWVIRDFIPYLRWITEEHGHLHIHHNVEHFGPSAFFLGVRGRLFTVESDFSVNEHVHPYEAIGSGADTAMGVLHAEIGETYEPISDSRLLSIAEKALEAATKLTLYVGGDIVYSKTEIYTTEEKALARKILGEEIA